MTPEQTCEWLRDPEGRARVVTGRSLSTTMMSGEPYWNAMIVLDGVSVGKGCNHIHTKPEYARRCVRRAAANWMVAREAAEIVHIAREVYEWRFPNPSYPDRPDLRVTARAVVRERIQVAVDHGYAAVLARQGRRRSASS
jgi:hypothetical protein